MNKIILVVLFTLMPLEGTAYLSNIQENCQVYGKKELPSIPFEIDFSDNVNKVEICEIDGHRVYKAFSEIIEYSGLVCAFDLQVFNSDIGQFPVYKYFASRVGDSCPSNYENSNFIDLTNISSDIKPQFAINLLDKFLTALRGPKDQFEEYFDIPFWNRFFSSAYAEFSEAASKSSSAKIVSISKYLLTEDPLAHTVVVSLDGQLWSFLAELSERSFKVVSVPTFLEY